jgi:redox-sensitive bicupin YhaK (pirin superfamily)
MPARSIASLVSGRATQDGNQVALTRLIPGAGQPAAEAFRAMDPFLLMDHFGPVVLPPGSDAGFPPHPHRGFQTLTYMLQGAFRHRDSTGGAGLLRPGGAQLMTAGAGLVHEEMPVPEHMAAGGPIEGLQLWINLPRARKFDPPGYQDLQPDAMPWQPLPGCRLRALAGRWLDREGPARTPARIAYAHLELEPGAGFQHALAPDWTAAVVLLHGDVRIHGRQVPADHLALLARDGEGIELGTEGGASLMILAGEPLGEPIVHYGPFVMNTRAEIDQAVADYAAGRMGRID